MLHSARDLVRQTGRNVNITGAGNYRKWNDLYPKSPNHTAHNSRTSARCYILLPNIRQRGASCTKHVRPLCSAAYLGSVPNRNSPLRTEVAWNHLFVRGCRNTVGQAMMQFMYLMVRDKVRFIAGDFNQGFGDVTAVMEALGADVFFESYSKVHASDDHAGSGMEITAIMINYTGSGVPCQVLRKESFQNLDNNEYGIKFKDTSCHIPLAFIVSLLDTNPHRGGWSCCCHTHCRIWLWNT